MTARRTRVLGPFTLLAWVIGRLGVTVDGLEGSALFADDDGC